MLRKLNETYEYSLLRFLERDPEINLFIIGDLENFGFDKDFQEIWAEYNDEGEYIAVLLRYRTHFIFYSISEACAFEEFARIIASYPEASDISGSASFL
jgi:predicted GNAT family acetyltransferase